VLFAAGVEGPLYPEMSYFRPVFRQSVDERGMAVPLSFCESFIRVIRVNPWLLLSFALSDLCKSVVAFVFCPNLICVLRAIRGCLCFLPKSYPCDPCKSAAALSLTLPVRQPHETGAGSSVE
jgi:hypothetical protein